MADTTAGNGGLLPPPESDSNGVAVVFPLPEDVRKKLVQNGGTPVQDLHLTLGYLGDIEEVNISQSILSMITRNLDTEGVEARVNGVARFNGDQQDAIVALVDNQGLPEVRAQFETLLAEDEVELDADHGFTPHITLGYVDKNADTPNIRLDDIEFELGEPSVWWGQERQEDIEGEGDDIPVPVAKTPRPGKDKNKDSAKPKPKKGEEKAVPVNKRGNKVCHERARSLLSTLTGVEEKSFKIQRKNEIGLELIDTSGDVDVFKAENSPRKLQLRRSVQNRKTPIKTSKLSGRTRV